MPVTYIDVVTFNHNEAEAVERLLDDYSTTANWARKGPDALVSHPARRYMLRHKRLGAQGNVVAAAALAGIYTGAARPDFVVFYGCGRRD